MFQSGWSAMIKFAPTRLNSHSETCRTCPADKKNVKGNFKQERLKQITGLILRKVVHEYSRFNFLLAMHACMHACMLFISIIL